MTTTTLLDVWRHTVTATGPDLVLPDGCRDLIVVCVPGSAPTAFVSELHSAPVLATGFPPGTRLTGYRLAPGTRIEAGPLLSRVVHTAEDPGSHLSLIEEHCSRDAGIIEAFAGIEAAPVTTAADLARRLSLTPRTLQRLFSANRLPAPGFWLRLARARRAALGLRGGACLAEIAADAGYADQAHMTRAFRNWFGATPARLKSDPYRLSLLAQSGLAVPATGEQISTR
ncbi:MAG: AraC family transcriptional regulator [Stappia sp.]|uniref:AraC family transcriptional regulator n=1 Tax=Stappia sp. TaxID=1870903 RepID=UPI000C5B93C3|nr:helix-turn-helix domain-containing protein [Stappia sp.]MAA99506.1 AraC family transcriptional regulator [Stappia sp.]MBM20424.1 AraC family transcriptional regulator [Stappia sp.]